MQLTKIFFFISILTVFAPKTTFSTTLPDSLPVAERQLITANSIRKDARGELGVSILFTAFSSTFVGMAAITKGTALLGFFLYSAAGLFFGFAISALVGAIKRWRFARKMKEPCRECPPKIRSKRDFIKDVFMAIGFLFLGVMSILGMLALNVLAYKFLSLFLIILGIFIAFISFGFGIDLFKGLRKYKKTS